MIRWLLYMMLLPCLLHAQLSKVELSIKPSQVEVGEVFTITVTSEVQGKLEIDNLPSAFIQDYSIHQGSSQEMDHSTGLVRSTFFTVYTGIITKAGNYSIGPAYVKSNHKTYASAKVSLKVVKRNGMQSQGLSQKQLSDPAFGFIECNKKEIYEGESVVLAAKICSYYDPSHISGYQAYTPGGTVVKHPVGNNTDIRVSTERIKGKEVFAFQYDKNVVFPDVVGSYQIDPFKVNLHQGYKSYPITSSGLTIQVNPLPANPPAAFIGGVGEFSVEGHLDETKIKQGDVVTFTLTISGEGNLQNLDKPSLHLPKGFSIYADPSVEEEFSINSNGASGKVTYSYHIQVSAYGTIHFPEIELAYFDPNKRNYQEMRTDLIQLDVEKNKHYIQAPNNNSEPKTELLVEAEETKTNKNSASKSSILRHPLFWGGLTIPVIAFLFLLFMRKKKTPLTTQVQKTESIDAVPVLHYDEVRESLQQCISGNKTEPCIQELLLLLQVLCSRERGYRDSTLVDRTAIFDFVQTHFPEHLSFLMDVLSRIDANRYGLQHEGVSFDEIRESLVAFTKALDQKYRV